MNTKIRYQQLEKQFVQGLILCILNTELQEGAFLERLGMDSDKLEQIFRDFLEKENEEIYKRITIALDEDKECMVIGYVIGEDLLDVFEEIKDRQKDVVIELYCQIQREILKPLKEENHQFGDLIIIDSFGVNQEYQEQKVGQQIFFEFIKNSYLLGYTALAGLCYSRAAIHIAKKARSVNYNSLTLEAMEKINPKLTQHLKKSIELPLVRFTEDLIKSLI